MPYTATQLNAYYQSLTGTAPVGADAVLINASAAQSQNGTQSDTNTLLTVFNSAGVQATFEVAESTYQFFTGSGVSQAGLNFLEGNAGSNNANGLNTAFYTTFNTENRYYNFAINLASAGGAGNAGFVNSYGSLTFAQTVSAAYETIVGSSNVGTAAANAAIADITSRQAFFTSVAQQRAGGIDVGGGAGQNIALKAIVVGYILEEANKADVGTYAKAIDQLEASVAAVGAGAQITTPFGTNILTNFSSSGQGFNTGFNALGVTGATQTNFSLTTGIDTFQPTTGNIQFVGVVNQNGNTSQFNPSTLQGGDQVRGTGANNTLSIDTIGTVADATGGATISGVQTINVRAIADPQTGNAAGATLNANFTPGATSINAFQARGPVTLTNVGGSTAVGIVNDGTTTGGSLNATFLGTVTTATLNVAGGTTSGETATVAGAGLLTVNLNSNGGLNTLGTAAAAGPPAVAGAPGLVLPGTVTTLNVAATSALTVLGGLNDAALTKLTATGSNPINLGTLNATNLQTIDTTGLTSTGALTATINAPTSATTMFALGAGSDILTLTGSTVTGTNINLGGGTNSLTVTANIVGTTITGGSAGDAVIIGGNVDATSVINTGGGGDSVQVNGLVSGGASINGGGSAVFLTTGADFTAISVGAGFTTAQRALVTGFSTIGITDALTNGTTYDINAVGAQNFTTDGVAAGGTANLNANTGAVVTFASNVGAGGAGGNLSTNTGTLNIALANAATNTNDVLNLGYTGQPAQVAAVMSNVTTTNVETVNVTASGTVGNATNIQLNLNDAALTNISFAGNESISFTAPAADTALKSINGAADTGTLVIDATALTSTLNSPVVITTGSGNDIVFVRDFDRVTTGGVSGATGFNTINVAVTTSGQTYSSVLDAKATDHITFNGQTSTNATKIVLNSTAVFQDYLDAASATGLAVGAVSAFDFGGNTYLVENNNGAITYQNGVDSVIQLVGIHSIATTSTTSVILGS